MTISVLSKRQLIRVLVTALTIASLNSVLAAQRSDGLVVAGKVLDSTTNAPICIAEVRLRLADRSLTVAPEGSFSIADGVSISDTIMVTAEAYHSKAVAVSDLRSLGNNFIIYLNPKIVWTDEVVVTASRIPQGSFDEPHSVIVLTREEINKQSRATTADLLLNSSGVTVQKTTHGHGSPILRGLMGTYVNILYDGVRLNKSTLRYGPSQYLNLIDAEEIGRIEVVKGPTSVMYGSDAVGGTINLLSTPTFAGTSSFFIRPRCSMAYSSADRGKVVRVEAQVQGSRAILDLGVTGKKFHSLRAGGDIGVQNPTGWSEHSLNTLGLYRLGAQKQVKFEYLATRQDQVPRYDKYRDGSNQLFIYDPQNRDLAILTFESLHNSSWLKSYRANVSWQREVEGRYERKTGSSATTVSLDRVHTLGSSVQVSLELHGQHRTLLGAEYYDDHVKSERKRHDGAITSNLRPTFPDGSTYNLLGFFAQDRWRLVQWATVTAGVRYSFISVNSRLEAPYFDFANSYHDVSGTAALQLHPSEGLNLYLSWAKEFRAPNLDDIAVLETTNSGIDAPNPDLFSEHGNYFELGIKKRSQFLEFDAAVFYNQMRDLIERLRGSYAGRDFFDENGNGSRDTGEVSIFQKQNAARARIYGNELDLRMHINSQVQLRLNQQWTWGENQQKHEPLSRIPPLQIAALVRYLPTPLLWIELEIQHSLDQRRISERDRLDTRIGPAGTDGWTIVNLRAQIQRADLTICVGIDNLGDRAYKIHGSGIYQSGRSVVLKVSYQVGSRAQ